MILSYLLKFFFVPEVRFKSKSDFQPKGTQKTDTERKYPQVSPKHPLSAPQVKLLTQVIFPTLIIQN